MPDRSTKFLLVRHGRAKYASGHIYGQNSGVGLSEEGRRDAERIANAVTGYSISTVYSSPLDRTRETAEFVSRAVGELGRKRVSVHLSRDRLRMGRP